MKNFANYQAIIYKIKNILTKKLFVNSRDFHEFYDS